MLKRKMLRDIAEYKVQFISIFLMAFLGILVFTGIYVDSVSLETSANDYYNETNMADGWIYSEYLVDEFLEQVYLLGPTTEMERQLVVDSQARLDNSPDVTLHFIENNTISKFYLIEGKKLDINDSQGVWLDKSFADARNLSVGDEITFESNGTEITKRIRGLGYSPEYTFDVPIGATQPNYTAKGFAYLSHKAFPSQNIPYNVLNVKFDGNPDTFSKLLDYRLNGYYTLFLKKSEQHSVDVISETIAQQKSLSFVFPLIFVFISMLMLLTTMKRIISNQRTQIGILKANGFNNKRIMWHYLLSGFLLVVLGSVIGAVLGPIIFRALSAPSRFRVLKFPFWHVGGYDFSVISIIIMGALALIVSYYSIKHIIEEPPSSIIRPKAPKSSSLSYVEKLKFWRRLPFDFRWNFRSIKRNKFRALMTIVGVLGCTVLLITGFGLYESLNESRDWYFDDVIHYESKLILEDNTDLSQVNAIACEVNGVPVMESSIEILNKKPEFVSLLVYNQTDMITFTDDNHQKVDIADDEVSISKKLAEKLDIHVGDVIDCNSIGENKNVKIRIDRIHSSPFSQGLVMSPDKWESLGLEYSPTYIVTSQHVNESHGVKSVVHLDNLIGGWDRMEEAPMLIIYAMVSFAVVLVLVILYNLNVMSFSESERDIATLKVLGFRSSYLTRVLSAESAYFIVIGFLAGIPVGYQLLLLMIYSFGDTIYMRPSISMLNMAITIIIIISVSVVTGLYFLGKIRKLNMADSLKELER